MKADDARGLRPAFQALHDGLDDAYWSANGAAARSRILAQKAAVARVLDGIDAADLESRTGALLDLARDVSQVVRDMSLLRADLDSLVADVSAATGLAKLVDAAVASAAAL